MSSIVLDIARELLFRNRDRRANPVLDGPLRPNSRLEDCPVASAALPAPDAIALAVDGSVYVTSGAAVYRFADTTFSRPEQRATFDGPASALTANPAGGVVVGVAGRGLAFVDGPDSGRLVKLEGSSGLACPTAILMLGMDEIYVCDGSRDNGPDRWAFDLMEKRRSGRLLRLDGSRNEAETLASGLAFPNGICLAQDGEALIVSEAWGHNLLRLARGGPLSAPEVVVQNLPGYPARIERWGNGYVLAMFALRTQLVDFVLTEDAYRRKMIDRIDPAFWIVPALRSEGHYLEPVQGGGLRKHGSVKAWAPPRSYGLVIVLDADLEPEDSLHSRVGGTCHGITGLAVAADAVFAVSKGHDKILRVIGGETVQ